MVGMLLKTSDPQAISKTINKYQIAGQRKKREVPTRKRSINFPPRTGEIVFPHRKYLQNRRFNPDKIEKIWGIKGTQYLSGNWNWRIIIPIYNAEGNMVAYTGRAITDDIKSKYKMVDKKDILESPTSLLYGIHKTKSDAVIIVEGVTDVWRIGPGAVAVLGIGWHQEQANILRKFKRRYVLFDPEHKAQERGEKLAKWLSNFPGETEIIGGFGCDPGDMSEGDVSDVKSLLKK
jgi:hypothetical protein